MGVQPHPRGVTRRGPDHLVHTYNLISQSSLTSPQAQRIAHALYQHTVSKELPGRHHPTTEIMRVLQAVCLFALLALATSATLNGSRQVKVRSVFRQLVGINGEGRSAVASLPRETTRIRHDEIVGRNSTLVYLEVDKETTRVIAEIQPGAAPRATGRFWVDEGVQQRGARHHQHHEQRSEVGPHEPCCAVPEVWWSSWTWKEGTKRRSHNVMQHEMCAILFIVILSYIPK